MHGWVENHLRMGFSQLALPAKTHSNTNAPNKQPMSFS